MSSIAIKLYMIMYFKKKNVAIFILIFRYVLKMKDKKENKPKKNVSNVNKGTEPSWRN